MLNNLFNHLQLHDIKADRNTPGYLEILLSEPGQLTELEFKMVETHPKVGYEILRAIEITTWPIAGTVLQHHERMGGSGYSHGVSGEETCMEERILGVVDVVEAMSSRRPYRPARGIDKALEEISQNKGNLYDPDVSDACLRIFKDKNFKSH